LSTWLGKDIRELKLLRRFCRPITSQNLTSLGLSPTTRALWMALTQSAWPLGKIGGQSRVQLMLMPRERELINLLLIITLSRSKERSFSLECSNCQ
jgi:hypothetical protein